jgi:hypothetical protein
VYKRQFIVGSIAKGFFSKLGSDLYERFKGALVKYYQKRTSSEQILDLCFLVKQRNRNFEVHVVVANPSEQELNELFASKFEGVDTLLASLTLSEPDVAKVVFENENQRLLMRYAVRDDSVPLIFVREIGEEGNGANTA